MNQAHPTTQTYQRANSAHDNLNVEQKLSTPFHHFGGLHS